MKEIICSSGSKVFKKFGKSENSATVCPESVPIHLKWVWYPYSVVDVERLCLITFVCELCCISLREYNLAGT